jgi:mannobiose 2-epimerase
MPTEILDELRTALTDGILRRWYPLVVDNEYGGYFTNVTCDWTLPQAQEKMIVTQARHVWTASKVAAFTGDAGLYVPIAEHGYRFLRDVMWDAEYGGFYQIRDRSGGLSDFNGWRDEKRAYGNAFALYGLAALYTRTKDPGVLETARRAFHWIEDNAYDPRDRGYFEFLTREGKPFDRTSSYKTIAGDSNELGFKDQNSSIHLLEAYTELYRVWPDPLLGERLAGLLELIRDTMVHERGYLQLFFEPDWTPVSFKDAPEEVRRANYGLDHVSFGHDYETAFLMLEASHALGLENDTRTLHVARKMLDHALANGWERGVGGFFDAAYYLNGNGRCTIIRETKNWWAQAEALNALLLFSRIYPESEYRSYFLKQWEYVKKYIIDGERGDWFEGGIDREPHFRTGPRSHIWKCTYHTSRALMNCIALLSISRSPEWGEGFETARKEIMEFVGHWHAVAAQKAEAQEH